MENYTLEKTLYDCGVYNAWQFVVNTYKTIQTAEYCKNTIYALISQMTEEHSEWENNLFNQLKNQEGKIKKISITSDILPTHSVNIAGNEVGTSFLLDKLTKDFFQYCRNAFDSISQIANAGCLAFYEKKVESVDFPCMNKVFQQQTYVQAFPDMANWYLSVSASDEYQYLDAFCNRTKHTCDVYLKVSMAIMGGENHAIINPFFRKDVQHEKHNIKDYLATVFEFVTNAYKDFLTVFESETKKKIFTSNRFSQLFAYQQRFKDNEDSDFSVVFIEEDDDFGNMPEEIEVLLLLEEKDGKILSKNCEIDNIYVRSKSNEHEYCGKYVAIESCGDDTLLRYRRYKKQMPESPSIPILFDIMKEWKKNKIFYHNNPFISITTVSDIDDFLARVQLPF